MASVSLNAQCASTFSILAELALDDRNWRAFGYKRRPRRGQLFLGFTNAAKLERETVLLRELLAAGLSAVHSWAARCDSFTHRVPFIGKLLEFAIDGAAEPLWPVFLFPSRRDAVEYLTCACSDYRRVSQDGRAKVFIARCKASLSQPIPPAWLAGTAWLFIHPDSVMPHIDTVLMKTRIADNSTCDILINDPAFLSAAARTLVSQEESS